MRNIQIEDELAGLEEWAEEDYVDFDPVYHVDSPDALARQMKVPPSYISKLEHADQVSDEALQKVKAVLQELRKR